jgi:ribonuclease HI
MYKETNNTGKLFAALKCLKQIHENRITNITIKTNSKYLVRGITK